MSFNPRARKERDVIMAAEELLFVMFQSTRPQGARHGATSNGRAGVSFNPRARKERDLTVEECHSLMNVSIHAPARSATRVLNSYYIADKFQSTRPQGARL